MSNLGTMKWLAGVAAMAIVMVGGFALADTDSDRAELIRNIDDKVGNIADKLSGFESRRDYDYADDALSYARDVRDLVGKLDGVKASDSRANDIVSRYPGYVDSFREATRYLKKLKELQFLADGVADRCTHDEADLQTIIRNYVGRPDEADEAFDKLPAKGQDYGKIYAPLLDKLRDADRELGSSASYARFSVSDDKWSYVTSNFTGAAERMVGYWRDHYSPIDAACKRLALGDKHPDIEHALDDLRRYTGDTKQTVTQLKKDYNAWLADARKLREMTTQDHEALREVMCRTGGEYDMARMVDDLSSCRADCVLPGSTCMIVEIKPDSDRAKEEGEKQRDAYKKGLAAWYARNKEELFKTYPDIQKCEHDGKLDIDTRPEIYNFCPSSSEARDMGENLDGISSDVSESE